MTHAEAINFSHNLTIWEYKAKWTKRSLLISHFKEKKLNRIWDSTRTKEMTKSWNPDKILKIHFSKLLSWSTFLTAINWQRSFLFQNDNKPATYMYIYISHLFHLLEHLDIQASALHGRYSTNKQISKFTCSQIRTPKIFSPWVIRVIMWDNVVRCLIRIVMKKQWRRDEN